MKEGYNRFSKNGQNYLMRAPEGLVFVAAPRFIEEIRSASDDALSAMAINNSTLQVKYTLHPALLEDWYEFDVVRKQLTQTLGASLPEIVDECRMAFSKELGSPADFAPSLMWPIACHIVTRTTNRLLFGSRLAADEDFLRLSVDYTYTVFGGAHVIRAWPAFLRPLVLRLRTGVVEQSAIAKKFLAPELRARIQRMRDAAAAGRTAEFEKEKPNDAIQWVLDITPANKLDDVDILVYRMLHLSISAIHTSSSSFADAIYDLALHPDIHDELCEEIKTVLTEEGGWNKQALTRMTKMDSFMKESARWHPFLAGSIERLAMRDFPLSDGTVITKGTKVTVPHYAMYFDEAVYGPTAADFDAFRFSKRRTQPGQETKHSFVQCTPDFTHFGYGKHACPGRFFAANEIKMVVARVVAGWDVAMPCFPDPTRELLFRKVEV
ncbi:putative cytochrome p450 protein [Neofusicoccum parvum UCRNP2]|uniref:Putative cytochrome p450 protein n=1 Tax=Botryosphaeria parva (strain UCR-NP2) TaxID=1287680 RepID=R1GXK5_BOTPV|nr:putative cytochrome p450 protein [Neofusicoccum parvum UCRNP2]